MINLLIGAPGGGKSYEATVFHLLPALQKGRLVVTNLPVNVDELEKIVPGCSLNLVLLNPTKDNPIPFSTISDYHYDQKTDDGHGPLYIIDEAHFPLPASVISKGIQETQERKAALREVEEWFSMHRHYGADVLLLTQNARKISRDITAMAQMVYYVRKNVAMGRRHAYIRKVRDGLRGDVVNTSERKYQKKYFPLYTSHTKSSGVEESSASDIRPFWRHWSVIGAALFLPIGIVALASAPNPLSVDRHIEQSRAIDSRPTTVQEAMARDGFYPQQQANNNDHNYVQHTPGTGLTLPPPTNHPLFGYGIHVLGYIEAADRFIYQFGISQNGQLVYMQTMTGLEQAGYTVHQVNDCMARLEYASADIYVHCDSPKQQVSRVSRMD